MPLFDFLNKLEPKPRGIMVSVSVPIVSLVPIDLTNKQKVITRVWIPYVSSEHTNNTLKTALEKYNAFYGLNLQISSLELRIETFKSLGGKEQSHNYKIVDGRIYRKQRVYKNRALSKTTSENSVRPGTRPINPADRDVGPLLPIN